MVRIIFCSPSRYFQACLATAFLLAAFLVAENSASACMSVDDLDDSDQILTTTLPHEGPWQATYWNNAGMFGDPALVRNEAEINAFYGPGSPAPEVSVDNYSARFTRDVVLPADIYRFTVTADDGIRVFIDGHLVVDQWNLQDSPTFSVDVLLSAGNHHIMVEYFEHTGHSEIRVRWQGLQASDEARSK